MSLFTKAHKHSSLKSHYHKLTSSSRAFTLLEILLVVAIIAILAGIVIVAINPAKQLGSSRDAERKADIATIYKAVNQYLIDHGTLPTTITTTLTSICDPLKTCTGIDLSALVPTYIPDMPKDPQATTDSGYSIQKVGNNVYVEAPSTEQGFLNQPGYSSTTPIVAFVGKFPVDYTPPVATAGTGGGGGGGGGTPCPTCATGLVGYWKGDGNTTDLKNGNNGTWSGSTSYDTGNNQAQAFSFDGSSYISLPAIPTGSSAMSAGAWVNTSAGGYLGIVGSGNGAFGPRWEIMKDPGSASPYIDFGTGCEVVASGHPIVGSGWHYVVFTYDGSTLSIYVDAGSPSSTSCSTTIDDSLVVGIGDSPNYGYDFNGEIQGVAIWNRALTVDEITTLYNSGNGISILP